MKAGLLLVIIAGLYLMAVGFQKKEPKSQQDLMKEYIDEQVILKRAEEWRKCRATIVADAERYVDSIIYQQVNFNIGDSLKAPGKPMKPIRPFDTLVLDTTPVKPIFEN